MLPVKIDRTDDPPTSFSAFVRFARPNDTTQYGAEDVVGPADGSTIEFKNIGLPGQRIMITSHSLLIEDTGVIASETSYRLYLYNRVPQITRADNTVWDITAPDRDSFVGYVALGTVVDLGSTLYVETNIANKQLQMVSSSLWGFMTTAGNYTPTANRVFVPKLHSILV